MSSNVDHAKLQARVRQVSRAMGYHGGGHRLEDVSAEGAVKLRFVGMCSGCPTRVLRGAHTVTPALLEIDGVQSVELPGARISDEARARFASAFNPPAA